MDLDTTNKILGRIMDLERRMEKAEKQPRWLILLALLVALACWVIFTPSGYEFVFKATRAIKGG